MKEMLVSVVVVTYNSSEFIIDALDSVKSQTYQSIELIITDDCSQDNTVELCRDWLKSNKSRFINSELLTVEKNTGITANYNRGWKRARGEWIKGLDGDDRLLPNCITDNVEYVISNPNANFVFSKVLPIGNIEVGRNWPFLDVSSVFDKMTPLQIRIVLCERNFLPSASEFIRRSTFIKLCGFDESIPLQEDWALWMKAVNNGYELSFLKIETAEYRFSDCSISQKNLSKEYLECNERVVKMGEHYLSKISVSSFLFCLFRKKIRKGGFFVGFWDRLNKLNPFYHQFEDALNIHSKLLMK